MGGQLDGNFLPVSLSDKFILIVTLIICFVVNNFFLYLSNAAAATQARQAATPISAATLYATQNVNTLWTAVQY